MWTRAVPAALSAGVLSASVAHGGLLVRTLAGRGIGDRRPAVAASLNGPSGVAVAADGALLVADRFHDRVRRVDPATGVITTLAGTIQGTGGNGLPADEARLKGPLKVRVDPATGDVLVAEVDAHTIRRIAAATGVITRVAGTPDTPGATGDAGPAASARLRAPADAAPDDAGGFWIADSGNHRVRHVDAGGTITTVAGTGTAGYTGDGRAATAARLRNPVCVLPAPGGGFWVCDQGNHVVRFVDADGDIDTVAGTGTAGFTGDGPATAVALRAPSDLALDGAGGLLVADQGNDRIRRLDLGDGTLATIAGTGTRAFTPDGAAAAGAALAQPLGLAVAADGRVLVAEAAAHRVRAIADGVLATVAGDGVATFGGDGGPAVDATFGETKCVTPAPDGDLVISDTGNNRVRRLDAATGTVDTIAGSGAPAPPGDGGPATAAGLTLSDAVLAPDGDLVVSDTENHRIRRVDAATGLITTIVGDGEPGFSGDDGPAAGARIDRPTGIEIDAQGNLWIADFNNHRIRRVDAVTGIITTVAGTGVAGDAGDGGPATAAQLDSPTDLLVDVSGDLFIADYRNHRIRRVAAGTREISTVAGTGVAGDEGDGGPATAAELDHPSDVKRGADGALWVVDSMNHRIRRFAVGGAIETVAGTGLPGYAGDGGPAAAARLLVPLRLLALPDGRVLVADRGNFVVRALLPDADDDGVPDVEPLCPLPPDRDGDGVADGCDLDADGDGVANAADACPATASGLAVDAAGCACADPERAPCDDGDPCTTDACDAATATCTATPVRCDVADACHDAGTCDPATGLCTNPRADGRPCDDGDACTRRDACRGGLCVGEDPVSCEPADQCREAGACDGATGTCAAAPRPDGTPCDDGNACTQNDGCAAGTCVGVSVRCGDGVVDGACGERCDEGDANGSGGCCTDRCAPLDADGDGVCDRDDPCSAPVAGPVPRLRLARREAPAAGGTVTLVGRVGALPPFDPAAGGLRVVLEDVGGTVLLDAVAPGGARWRTGRRGRRWRFADPHNRPGITRARLRAVRGGAGGLRFAIRATGAAFSAGGPAAPLVARLALDAPGAGARCAQWRFGACTRRGEVVSCR